MTDTLVAQLGLALAVVATMMVGPGIAIIFLIRRKRLARARRKSPLGFDLLRPPGHSLSERIEVLNEDFNENLIRLMAIPALTAGMYFAQQNLMGPERVGGRIALIYTALLIAVIVYCVRKMLSMANELDKLKAGHDAEVAVGQQLDQLMRQGAWVYHDVPGEQFNIDHVVVAPQGVYAVETKGYTKLTAGDGKKNATVTYDGKALTFPTGKTTQALEQSVRQAQWLSRWLTSATGNPVTAMPVLALPGWFVDRTGKGNVFVFSGPQLKGLLAVRSPQPVSAERVQQIVHQLEQRCRDVKPRYSR